MSIRDYKIHVLSINFPLCPVNINKEVIFFIKFSLKLLSNLKMKKVIFCTFAFLIISQVLSDHAHIPNKQKLREEHKTMAVVSKGHGKVVIAVVPDNSDLAKRQNNSGVEVRQSKDGEILLVKEGHVHELDESDHGKLEL